MVNNVPIENILDPKLHSDCLGISDKMATNIIRVASSRIFSDIYRSLIEPVSNSIDSYNSLIGKKNIGKFGMGFFSLLYWLNKPESKLTVISNNNLCSWYIEITKENGEYYFQLIKSTPTTETGTQVKLEGIDFDKYTVKRKIISTFLFIDTVDIIVKDHLGDLSLSKLTYHNNFLPDYRSRPVYITIDNSSITYTDYATGIAFEHIFKGLLVPSLSTKTLESFVSSSEGFYKPSRIEQGTGFMITIGDVTIYSNKIVNYEFIRYTIDQEELMVLSLPAEFPMPVSRDDVILESKYYQDIFYNSLEALFYEVIKKGISINELIDYLKDYTNYAVDINVDLLTNKFIDSIMMRDDVILIPDEYHYLKEALSIRKDIYIVTSKIPDNYKLTRYIKTYFSYDSTVFKYVSVVFLDLVKNGPRVIRITPEILIVDRGLTTNVDWVSNIITSSDILLTPVNGGGETSKDIIKDYESGYRIVLSNRSFPRYIFEFKFDDEILNNLQSMNIKDFIYSKTEGFIDIISSIINTYRMGVAMFREDMGKENRSTKMGHMIFFILTVSIQYMAITNNYQDIIELLYYFLMKYASRTFSTQEQLLFKPSLIPGYEVFNPFVYVRDRENIYQYPVYFPEYRERLYKLYVLSLIPVTEYNRGFNQFYDAYQFCIISVNQFRPYLREVYNYISDKDVIYDLYISAVFHVLYYKDLYKVPKNLEELMVMLNFIYKELASKSGTNTLRHAQKGLNQGSENHATSIVNKIVTAYRVFVKTLDVDFHIEDRGVAYSLLPNVCFTAKQLINYIFDKGSNVSNNPSWLEGISSMSTDNPLQSIEIAINEGTSKSYIDSILTELVQNSMDASLSLENPRIDITTDPTGIAVSDKIGIPFKGLVSLMIPFLSTKGDSLLTTGEMGSGFMNVFRQPGTHYVRVTTRDPETRIGYMLHAYPIKSRDRVIDIKYEIGVSYDYDVGGTEVYISYNNYNVSYLVSAVLFSNIFLSVINVDICFNGELLKRKIALLDSNQIADIYTYDQKVVEDGTISMDKSLDSKSPIQTIILTNGIPHTTYSYTGNNDILNNVSTGMIINIRKDSYIPSQTRKRIYMADSSFDELMTYAGVVKYMHLASISPYNSIEYAFPGITYHGDPIQVRPMYVSRTSQDSLSFDSYSDDRAISYTSKYFNHGSIAYSIGYFINTGLDWTQENINKYIKGSDLYKKCVYAWFMFKTKSSRKIVNGVITMNIESVDIDISKIPPSIIYIIDTLTKKVWNGIRSKIRGYTMGVDPPTIKYKSKIEGALGFYSSASHSISIDMSLYNLDMLGKSTDKLKELLDAGNNVEASVFYKSDPLIYSMFGISPNTKTFIHEFGHSIRSSSHTDPNPHGNFKYEIGDVSYDYTFEKGCNELWRLGLLNVF